MPPQQEASIPRSEQNGVQFTSPLRKYAAGPPSPSPTSGFDPHHHEKRLADTPGRIAARPVSIHAPREGGDDALSAALSRFSCFNPRPPRGRRPLLAWRSSQIPPVSIHAPPAREATRAIRFRRSPLEVSIHAPREGGDSASHYEDNDDFLFQSTPPAREATRPSNRIAP